MNKDRELKIWRDMMNSLYMYRNITMDGPPIHHILACVDKWGRAHTVGNGQLDNDKLVKKELTELEKRPWADSAWNSGVETKFKPKVECVPPTKTLNPELDFAKMWFWTLVLNNAFMYFLTHYVGDIGNNAPVYTATSILTTAIAGICYIRDKLDPPKRRKR